LMTRVREQNDVKEPISVLYY